MFFWEILKAGLLAEQLEPSLLQADYAWPPEVALVHQAGKEELPEERQCVGASESSGLGPLKCLRSSGLNGLVGARVEGRRFRAALCWLPMAGPGRRVVGAVCLVRARQLARTGYPSALSSNE